MLTKTPRDGGIMFDNHFADVSNILKRVKKNRVNKEKPVRGNAGGYVIEKSRQAFRNAKFKNCSDAKLKKICCTKKIYVILRYIVNYDIEIWK